MPGGYSGYGDTVPDPGGQPPRWRRIVSGVVDREVETHGERKIRGDATTIAGLVAALGSDRWGDRRRAEDQLRQLRAAAVPALIEALSSEASHVRWGAAKVLGEIRATPAVEKLVLSLEDEDGGVRWLAATSLIAIGKSSLIPLLRRILRRPDSPWLQEGTHHVLRGVQDDATQPVLAALESHYPAEAVPPAVNDALAALESRS